MSPAVENIVLFNKFSPYRLPRLAAAFDASDLTSITVDASNRVSAWADKSGLAHNLAQATGANQPLLLPWQGSNYAYLPSVNGNYLSSPSSAALQITGDIDLRVKASLETWSPAASQATVARWQGGGSLAYVLVVDVGGTLKFFISTDGTTNASASSSVATGFSANSTNWIRVTRSVSGGTTTFYTSTDGATWNQLGTTQVISSGSSIFAGSSIAEIGSISGGTNFALKGSIYRAQIYNGIAGTLVFDADLSRVPHNATSFAEMSSNGATVTVNQSGAMPAQIVGRSSVLFDGSAYYMATGNFALNQPCTYYFVGKQITWTNQDAFVTGGANKLLLYQASASPQIYIFSGSSLGGETNLALGTIGIKTAVFNGASSSLRTNLLSGVTGDVGAVNGTLLTVGSDSINPNQSNIQVQKLFVFSAAHDTATQNRIIKWLGQQEAIIV
jgi:hypothetical protein